MASKYETGDMNEALVDFALSMDPSMGLRLFDGGLIVTNDETPDRAMVVATTPDAEAEAFSPLCTVAQYALIEQTLADNQARALREHGLGDWTLVDHEPFDLPADAPLSFFVIEREKVAA
jgi:hypothetical protein